jgi:DNA repair exonuclease SbcCD ATPase subunit
VITKLRLTNFRRHENTVINLGPEDATVVVSGLNGAGKSTIIESIVYALVGEGRHGARSLDRLVRRGAEIEGMEVELEFSIDNTSYRILRRREGKNASAVLCVNGQATVEGSRHVTNAVEDILGMDSQGIRLAVVAYQKELDLLVSLSGAARSKAIGRLLRLDAIAKARDDARNAWRVA